MTRGAIRGFALVEVLVALALGLLVVVAGATAYLGASEASRMADLQARLHDDAQTALALLAQQLRMAGSRSLRGTPEDASALRPALRGCDGTFHNIRTAAGLEELACSDAADAPHAFGVRYEADPFNTLSTATGEPTDCLGNALKPRARPLQDAGAAALWYLADNRYFIAVAGATAVPSLYCKGAGGTAQPMVDNVEDLRLLYGVAATESQSSVAGYRTARELNAEAAAGAGANPWSLVRAVTICIVVRSEQPVPETAWTPYRRCDGELEARPPDRRLRRSFSTTVALRNVPGAALRPALAGPDA